MQVNRKYEINRFLRHKLRHNFKDSPEGMVSDESRKACLSRLSFHASRTWMDFNNRWPGMADTDLSGLYVYVHWL
jgi:hypothetical protein